MTQQPFNPGMFVQPSPVSSACAKTPDGSIILHFEHVTGSTIFVLDAEFVKGLINQLQEVSGGLVIPNLIPQKGP